MCGGKEEEGAGEIREVKLGSDWEDFGIHTQK